MDNDKKPKVKLTRKKELIKLVRQLAEKSSKRELDRLIGFIAGQLYKKTEEEQENKKP